jgi:hypothetical protein
MADMDVLPIELPYEIPTPPAKHIVIRHYSDGGVTVVIPPIKVTLVGIIIGILLTEWVFFLAPVAFIIIYKHRDWHPLEILTLLSLVVPGLLLLAILFPRKADPNEIIAISPSVVYIKPRNSGEYSLPRIDLKRVEIRARHVAIHYYLPRRINLLFHKNQIRSVCKDRTDIETQSVAEALQKAIDATASTQVVRDVPSSLPAETQNG